VDTTGPQLLGGPDVDERSIGAMEKAQKEKRCADGVFIWKRKRVVLPVLKSQSGNSFRKGPNRVLSKKIENETQARTIKKRFTLSVFFCTKGSEREN